MRYLICACGIVDAAADCDVVERFTDVFVGERIKWVDRFCHDDFPCRWRLTPRDAHELPKIIEF